MVRYVAAAREGLACKHTFDLIAALIVSQVSDTVKT
jgi:hypothetical protein